MTLLFWSEAKKNHYAWIKNVNPFLSSQTEHVNAVFMDLQDKTY